MNVVEKTIPTNPRNVNENVTATSQLTLPPATGQSKITVEVPVAAQAVTERLIGTSKSCKVAVAQISTDPGKIAANTEKIIRYIELAKERGAEVVVFPELTIPGYGAMDLFFNENYILDNVLALEKIRRATAGITAIVGFARPEPFENRPGGRKVLYNSAAIIRDQSILHTQDKELLPTYNIFFEERYFTPAKARNVVQAGRFRIGTEICEDLWSEGYQSNPTAALASENPDFIVNLSCSPFEAGKLATRTELIGKTAQASKLPFIYTNLVGSFDGYDGEVVFDGRSIVMGADGQIKALGKAFSEELMIVDVFSQQELVLPQVNRIAEMHDALVLGLKDFFRRVGNGKPMQAILGLSGGIDSALVAAIAVEALGKENVLGITMPSEYSSSETKSDAALVAENLGIRFKTVSIEKEYKSRLAEFRTDPDVAALPDSTAEECLQARLRAEALMYYSNKLGGLVLNTGNKTELALDNCTLYGDMIGAIAVIGDVDKDFVYELADYINIRAGRELIPQATIDRVPTAELKPNQIDADVMGGDPRTIAPAIRKIVEEQMSFSTALQRFRTEYSPELIQQWFRRLDRSEGKRRQAPPAIRVSKLAFGLGRRVPMNHRYLGE